jgi:hypothetical protein
MQFGEINKPIQGFEAQRQIIILFLNSQPWELPFAWDYGWERNAIDPAQQIQSGIAKYLDFTVDSVEVVEREVTINLKGKKISVTISN